MRCGVVCFCFSPFDGQLSVVVKSPEQLRILPYNIISRSINHAAAYLFVVYYEMRNKQRHHLLVVPGSCHTAQ